VSEREQALPYVIAEAGSCHEETLSNAIQLIQAARHAGADAVKFQCWSNPARMRARRHIDEPSAQYDLGSVRPEWLGYLKHTCEGLKMAFALSVFLPEDVEVVSTYVDVFKVSSFEARDRELTRAIEKVRGERPWFISTGMQDEAERATLPRGSIRLHCVSAYPCPMEQANLGAIELHEGYSDHTRCIYTGGLAVAAGADYLEVHYRLDHTSRACPDYPVSLDPAQLASYIYFARTAALARGAGEKVIQDAERENMRYRVVS
jgi:sialic acid synthase SpsE